VNIHGWWRTGWLILCMMVIGALAIGSLLAPVAGQEPGSTPELDTEAGEETASDPSEDPVVTPTPVVGSASGQGAPDDAADEESEPVASQQQPGEPVDAASGVDTADPVLAQGLVYLSGGDVVWQVREVELTGSSTVTGNSRVILQRSGASIVRNDVTGKRARLEPGEAYFAAAGDPYTTFAETNTPAVVWVFEISNSNVVGDGAFYLSPSISGYGEAVYDYAFTRHIVDTDRPATVSGGDGPSMFMVLAGQVNVTDDEGTATLAARDGLIVRGDAVIESVGAESVVVSMTVGPEVSDASAAPPASVQTPESAETQEGQAAPQDAAADEDQSASETTPPAASSGSAGTFVTSIKVGARQSIGVTMYVDGVTVFDGWLSPGEWTSFYDGSTFEVFTTSGENTLFENACGGEPFVMGYETGDANYVLEATASSCAPVGD
jgi:hypothetical protein